jgi:5-methylcytosine-specific restriction endonuclease McrA
VAEGRLHLSGIVDLAPHLEAGNADELLAAAAHKTRAAIALLLAERFPKPDVPTLVMAIDPVIPGPETAPAPVAVPGELSAPGRIDLLITSNTPQPVAPQSAPLPVRAKPVPLSPGRFALQVTVDQATHDQLRYAQALLGHSVPSGDVAEVLKRALDALVEKLEKKKLAKSDRPRPQRATAKNHQIPAAVRRSVWARDGGECTFVGEHGKRCESRTRVELDHIVPVAKGGQPTTSNLRLLCHAHNQYAAECSFGAGFMNERREHAQDRAANTKADALHASS